jgi:hypothetical protein
MKVTVTHLKAPWPAGCVPGDVVDLCADAIPAWAVGKCTPAADGAEAKHSMAQKSEAPADTGQPQDAIEAQAAQEKAAIKARKG